MIDKLDLKNKDNIVFYIACICVFLFSLFFPIVNSNVAIIILACFLVYYLVKEKGTKYDWNFQFLLLATVSIAILDFHAEAYYSITFGLLWCLGYLLGKFMIGTDHEQGTSRIMITMLAMGLGLFIQGVLNYSNGFSEQYISEEVDSWSSWSEYWTGIETARTLFVFDFLVIAAMLVFSVMIFKKHKVLSLMIIVANIIVIYLDFISARGRFAVCAQVVSLGFVGIIYLIKNYKSMSDRAHKIIKTVGIAIVALLLIVFASVKLNIAGLGDIYAGSFLNRDGGIFNNVRFESIREGIALAISYPQGGWNVEIIPGGAPHNVILLFGREYDSLVMLILFVFMLFTVKDFIKLLLGKNITKIDYMLGAVHLVMILYFNLETGPWRYRNYWMFLLLVDGMLRRRIEQIKSES